MFITYNMCCVRVGVFSTSLFSSPLPTHALALQLLSYEKVGRLTDVLPEVDTRQKSESYLPSLQHSWKNLDTHLPLQGQMKGAMRY